MNKRTHWILYAAMVALYLLHNDWWFWNDARIVFGLPVGLTYHIGYNVAAAVLMFLLVRFAWPSHLEVAGETSRGTGQPGGPDRVTVGETTEGHAASREATADEAAGGAR